MSDFNYALMIASTELWFLPKRKLGNFFPYVCNSKQFKKLFASTLNGIAASVRCVSST